jgi:hypothetical protein
MYCNVAHGVYIRGEFKPTSTFWGNSIVANLRGSTTIFFREQPSRAYKITYPNIVARGIFFGESFIELAGTGNVEGIGDEMESAKIAFKEAGFFDGSRDEIEGQVHLTSGRKIVVSGRWSDTIFFEEEAKVFNTHLITLEICCL